MVGAIFIQCDVLKDAAAASSLATNISGNDKFDILNPNPPVTSMINVKADIYTWKAQDIPEPKPSEGLLDSGVPIPAQDIIRDALTGLLEHIGEFCMAPHVGFIGRDLDSELGQIDQEIERIRSVMLAIKYDLGRRVAALCKRRNAMTPFNRLPPELVGLVLSNIISQPPTSPYESIDSPQYNIIGTLKNIVNVSTGLWRVVKSCPTLWTTIAEEPNEDTTLKLQHSGNLPLTIVRTYQLISNRSNFINLVVKHSARWKSVHLEIDTTEESDHIREALRGPMPHLERLELSVDEDEEEGSWDLPVNSVLRRVEALGMRLNPSTQALRSVQHLKLGSTSHVSITHIMATLASIAGLKSLTISSFDDSLVQPELGDSATEQKPSVQLPSLVSLTIEDTASNCVVALMDGIQANNLVCLQVEGVDGMDQGPVMRQLMHANERPSVLESVIVRSAVALIEMRIIDNDELEIVGKLSSTEGGVPNPVAIKLTHGEWFDYIDTVDSFPAFGASPPPVHLALASSSYTTSESLNFLHKMPTVTLIELGAYDEDCREALQRVLGHFRLVDGNEVWACPKLEEIRFRLRVVKDNDVETLMSTLRCVLQGRKKVDQEGRLPKITIKSDIGDEYSFVS